MKNHDVPIIPRWIQRASARQLCANGIDLPMATAVCGGNMEKDCVAGISENSTLVNGPQIVDSDGTVTSLSLKNGNHVAQIGLTGTRGFEHENVNALTGRVSAIRLSLYAPPLTSSARFAYILSCASVCPIDLR